MNKILKTLEYAGQNKAIPFIVFKPTCLGRFVIYEKLSEGQKLTKERERASKLGYQDPICKDKATTDALFYDVLIYMIKNLENMALFLGTYNEESTYLLLQLMTSCKIVKNDKRIWFGQLFGMSDHISYNLANLRYNVAKYLPYVPVKDVMPYLLRRAEENTSVVDQT